MMPTNSPSATDRATTSVASPRAAQTVLIVNGTTAILEVLETVLDAGHYDVVFIENTRHAYSHVKRAQPDLVILCLRMDDAEALQVLSMLKLDEATSGIPVLTYTAEEEEPEQEEAAEPSETDTLFPPARTAVLMN
jgi:PleD family two-component response regulator